MGLFLHSLTVLHLAFVQERTSLSGIEWICLTVSSLKNPFFTNVYAWSSSTDIEHHNIQHSLKFFFNADWGPWHRNPEEWRAPPNRGGSQEFLQSPAGGAILRWTGQLHDQWKLPRPGPDEGKNGRKRHQRVQGSDWSNSGRGS